MKVNGPTIKSVREADGWVEQLEHICKTGKPMMDFINNVVDDYE